ncbi:MAG: type II toxin-antitoxin system VapC family toxin [Pseudonocardiaceae bacterium]
MTTPSGLTLDAGALIALERGDRRVRVLLDESERAGWSIVVPVGPLAQVWRDGARQAELARFLNATDRVGIVEWDVAAARAAGVLCGRVGTSDVVDASVALCARERDHHIVTSDPQDFAVIDPQLPVIVV